MPTLHELFGSNCFVVASNGERFPLRVESFDFDPFKIGVGIEGYLLKDPRRATNNKRGIIDKVIFNDPATIVIWTDGTKTVVKCQEGDTYSKELGLAMCISKKYLGNKGNFNEEFKKWIPEDEVEKTSNEDISVEEMRVYLEGFCNRRQCSECPLHGREVCRCGWGTTFKEKKSDGSYDMTDDEIVEAYNKVFN